MEKMIFNSRDELLRINTDRIVYFEANGNYTTIVMTNKVKSSVRLNLCEMEQELSKRLKAKSVIFARIGKRFIVNLNFVYQIQPLKKRLIMTDCKNFTFSMEVSKDALKKLKDVILKLKY